MIVSDLQVRVLPDGRAVGGRQALQAAPQAPASQVQTLLKLFHSGRKTLLQSNKVKRFINSHLV